MYRKLLVLGTLLFIACTCVIAQTGDSSLRQYDTLTLKNVNVSAFSSALSKLKDVPAAISVLNKKDLNRFDQVSLLPVINTVPGVRMEERSPGSYRLSIRGSLLRSPFGVRDVKIYWDDLPLTDATGNTYLNLVDLDQLSSLEVIKGPASSLYGASTGGGVLLHSTAGSGTGNHLDFGLTGGSYGLFKEEAGWQNSTKNFYSSLQQGHLQSAGYREQSSLRKDGLTWNGTWKTGRNQSLSFLAFYTDLRYQTPGGLTLKQFQTDPSLARKDNVIQQAAVENKSFFGGITYHWKLGPRLENTSSGVLTHTGFTNPFITNYEQRNEWNYAARSVFSYAYHSGSFRLSVLAGGEISYNVAHIDDYGNREGVRDTLQFKDLVHTNQYFLFTQLTLETGKHLVVQTGLSDNKVRYWYIRTTASDGPQTKTAGPLPAPRFSVLYKLTAAASVFITAERGFSPPTLAEIRPSTGLYYGSLQPEFGWNYETGLKGTFFDNRLDVNASLYYFALQDAIVRRSDSTGAEYFVNAGSTTQKGLELWLKSYLIRERKVPEHFIASLSVWNNLTLQPYRFKNYTYDLTNYSGNHLTGVPAFTDLVGADAESSNGFSAGFSLNCTSRIPLDDANKNYAAPYQLLQLKFGKHFQSGKWNWNLFLGADNMLNQVYSLGNDINAFGGRYYNPAPKRSYFLGLTIAG